MSETKDHGWTEVRFDTLEWHPGPNESVRVCIGVNGVVEIDKLYGPLAVFPIRVRIDYAAYCWVIEREAEAPPNANGDSGEMVWIEVARAPCWPPEVTGREDE